jgi:hypothetical protein
MDKSLAAQFATKIRQQDRELAELKGTIQGIIKSCGEAPRSITEEIDSIPGRRIFYQLSERLSFTISDDGTRGQPMNMLVSQDGPFIQTHYPLVAWKPNLPDNATNFGQWSSVYSWPLPDQERPDRDFLDLSWELIDQGSQRNFQNEPCRCRSRRCFRRTPSSLSRPRSRTSPSTRPRRCLRRAASWW